MPSKLAYVIFASSFIAACGPDDTPGQNMTSKVIGTSGGSLTSADGAFTVTVDNNAFNASTEVTIEIHRARKLGSLASPVYEVRPHGVRLNTPAELTLLVETMDSAEDLERIRFTQLDPEPSQLDLVTFEPASRRIVALTDRFSSYGAFLQQECRANTDCTTNQVCDRHAGLCVNVPSPCDDGRSCL